ncbi:MAG: hypothetical protein D6B25_02480 [Desulfobulbaceae bacterium]|nr:MAG: hypothetical protein D6B25_02480 [Desulfobulbaceae bacterium]
MIHQVRLIAAHLVMFGLLIGFVQPAHGNKYADRHKKVVKGDTLYGATYYETDGTYHFIVDSYNNRVIYSRTLATPISEWKTLATGLSWPHSIATDGEFYLIDDTYADRVAAYRKTPEGFELTTVFEDAGIRPHRVRYDPLTKAFYVIGSLSQTMTKIRNKNGKLIQVHKKPLRFLKGAYTRSFSIIDKKMYFVSGPGKIHEVSYIDGRYTVMNNYRVPDGYQDMIDIYYSGNRYYLSSISGKVLVCEQLANLVAGRCEDIYRSSRFGGVPYYFSGWGDDIFVTSLDDRWVLKFQDSDGLTRPRSIFKN